MNKIVVQDVLLSYPKFNERFIIHSDAKKIKIGGVISGQQDIIAFYSHKLTPSK